MTEQPTLPLPDLPVLPHEATLQERFDAFHRANPHIVVALIALADELDSHRISVKMLWEVLRYRMIATHGDAGGFRLNNSYVTFYARLIAERRPDLRARIEMRRQKAAA